MSRPLIEIVVTFLREEVALALLADEVAFEQRLQGAFEVDAGALRLDLAEGVLGKAVVRPRADAIALPFVKLHQQDLRSFGQQDHGHRFVSFLTGTSRETGNPQWKREQRACHWQRSCN